MALPDSATQADQERVGNGEDAPQLSPPEELSASSIPPSAGIAGTEPVTAIVQSHDDEGAGAGVGDNTPAGNIDAENGSDQDGSEARSLVGSDNVGLSDYDSLSEASDDSGLVKAAKSLSSKALFEVYKMRLQRNRKLRRGQRVRFQQPIPGKTDSKGPMRTTPREFVEDSGEDQASALVRGVVDYLRVLEDRIKRIESGRKKQTVPPPMGPRGPQKTVRPDDDVELTVKFFDANAYQDVRGEFPSVHPKNPNGAVPLAAKPGHFLCAEDTQQIIRVLLSEFYFGESPSPRLKTTIPRRPSRPWQRHPTRTISIFWPLKLLLHTLSTSSRHSLTSASRGGG
jgi:hypothetical protein